MGTKGLGQGLENIYRIISYRNSHNEVQLVTIQINSILADYCQVKLMARSGRFYEKFWQHYIALFDGLVIEEEANLMGLGMTSGDEIALMPRLNLARKEILFLELCIGVRSRL